MAGISDKVYLKRAEISNLEEMTFLFETRRSPEVSEQLFGKPPSDFESHMAYLTKNQGVTREIFLICDEKSIVGYCQMSLGNKAETELGWAIPSAFQGRGYGKKSVRLLVSEARNRGFSRAVLFVKVQNEKAIHVYRDCGFVTESSDQEKIKMSVSFEGQG